MTEVCGYIRTIAAKDAHVLILGETGTGKSLVAEALHHLSPRKHAPFVRVDCGALSASLLESEFFGHEKGSFTDARRDTQGAFQAVGKGTLFLDEIGNLKPESQAKLLGVIESGEFHKVGGWGNGPKRFEGRIVVATNADLQSMVDKGTFRSDLYHRLRVVPLMLPTLRSRRNTDLPLLIDHFLRRTSPPRELTSAARALLLSYDYPGNVRELENIITGASVFAPGTSIDVCHLRPYQIGKH